MRVLRIQCTQNLILIGQMQQLVYISLFMNKVALVHAHGLVVKVDGNRSWSSKTEICSPLNQTTKLAPSSIEIR